MTGQNGSNSWLVPLADLSLILFIVTGATLAGSLGTTREEDTADRLPGGIAQGVAASIFTDSAEGPALADWLSQYHPAPGEQLTIEAFHTDADRSAITARAEQLAQQAISAGQAPRVIVQPAAESRIMAMYAYDRALGDDEQLARGLLQEGQN